ncbi:hypothetical protein H6P81_010455 [Aristolochia fimbriata]|uniref:Protein kinase domain-containing protein n=1 Tax=Aristolochia fimbriata TaxID=158543 RepID=A0AAV7EQW6_ARIFI|nr:hypothetical protein H6P81_010455 [Aristolochia fimbriata]
MTSPPFPNDLVWFILFPLFFFFFFAGSTNSQGSDDPYRACAPYPFRCGNMTDVTYPFLAGDRPPSCGFPNMTFTCENDSPMIKIGSEEYIVRDVRYPERLLTIVDRDIWSSDCPLSWGTPTFTNVYEFTAPKEVLTIYHNCSIDPASANPDYMSEIPCLGSGSIPSSAAGYDDDQYYSYFSTEPKNETLVATNHCNHSVEVHVLEGARDRLRKNQSGYVEVMKEGFVVKWLTGAGWCTECFLSGGICGSNTSVLEQTACFCPDGTRYASCSRDSKSVCSSLSAGVGGIILSVFLFIIKKKRKARYTHKERLFFFNKAVTISRNVEAFLENYGSFSPKRYKYAEIKKITRSFKDKLGQGGFGGVYKGKLDDGTSVAVKLLHETKGGNGEEFMNEVASIGRTSHVNVVTLMGFCSEGPKRALVYEFMPNGSLEKYIYTSSTTHEDHCKSQITSAVPHLGWENLYEIAVGIARGLEYLHRGCATRILHFDIKPHNILLDKEFCPKISDFGLAKLCPMRDSIISMLGTRGTVGYIAPEVFCRNFGGVSYKSDVYSYGMMVLEMVGGRKNITVDVDNTSEIYFPDWIYERLLHQNIRDIAVLQGKEIATEEEQVNVRKMILVGIWCIQTNPANRPSMSRVLEMLEGNLEAIQVPPKPCLSSPPRSLDPQASSTRSAHLQLNAED